MEFRVGVGEWSCRAELESGVVERSWRQERRSEAGEPTGARGNRRLSVVRGVHEPTRSESEGEHVCGPGVILTASVKGAREISAGQSPLAKQVARAVRARQNHAGGVPANCGSVSPERSEPRSGRYAGCEQVGRRPLVSCRAARRSGGGRAKASDDLKFALARIEPVLV